MIGSDLRSKLNMQEALCLSSSRPVKINVSGSLLVYPSVEAKLTLFVVSSVMIGLRPLGRTTTEVAVPFT